MILQEHYKFICTISGGRFAIFFFLDKLISARWANNLSFDVTKILQRFSLTYFSIYVFYFTFYYFFFDSTFLFLLFLHFEARRSHFSLTLLVVVFLASRRVPDFLQSHVLLWERAKFLKIKKKNWGSPLKLWQRI